MLIVTMICAVMLCAVCAAYHIVLIVVILNVTTPSEELQKVCSKNLSIVLQGAETLSTTSFSITTLSITTKQDPQHI
jgi:hypothetical protein